MTSQFETYIKSLPDYHNLRFTYDEMLFRKDQQGVYVVAAIRVSNKVWLMLEEAEAATLRMEQCYIEKKKECEQLQAREVV